MTRILSLACLLFVATPALAEHPNCIAPDDRAQTCIDGNQWDVASGECRPVVTG